MQILLVLSKELDRTEQSRRIFDALEQMDHPVFTVQRLCEILLAPKYSCPSKFIYALERVLMLAPKYVEPKSTTTHLEGLDPALVDYD